MAAVHRTVHAAHVLLGAAAGGVEAAISLGNHQIEREAAIEGALWGALVGLAAGVFIGAVIFALHRSAGGLLIGAVVGAIMFATAGVLVALSEAHGPAPTVSRLLLPPLVYGGACAILGCVVGGPIGAFTNYIYRSLSGHG